MLLKDRIAIITGAGKGIGRETAIDFAREGAHIVMVSRTKTDLDKLAEEIKPFNVRTLLLESDISVEKDVNQVFEETMSAFSRLDIIVCSAGTHLRKTIADTTVRDWDEMMAVNLRGTFLCSREAVKIMVKQDYGKIIIISSESGKKGSASQGAYCASKFGQIGLTEVLADEVKDYNINVNAVLPSASNTPMIKKSYPEVNREKLIKQEQVARVITFMASDDSSAIKGASIAVWNAQNYKHNLFNT